MMRNPTRGASRGFSLIEIMVVIAIIAGLASAVVIMVPQMMERGKKSTCQTNLGQLGKTYLNETLNAHRGSRPPYQGVAMWLSYRVVKNHVREGEETVFLCPGDGDVQPLATPEASKAYNDIDLQNPPLDMCSYAARNFKDYPVRPGAKTVQIIGCDRNGRDGTMDHHDDGVNIVFDNGSVQWYDRELLGISRDSPVVVGPDSEQEYLKQVIYAPHGSTGTKE